MEPFVGEIRLFAGTFAPAGWALCNGAIMAISEHETLFNLIGTTYGGDGQSTFALPNLSGRVPIHQGQGQGLSPRLIGQLGGVEEVTLTVNQLAAHTHTLQARHGASSTRNPAAAYLAEPSRNIYADVEASVQLAAASVGQVGGSQPHSNLMPFTCVNYIISLFGVFPSQT